MSKKAILAICAGALLFPLLITVLKLSLFQDSFDRYGKVSMFEHPVIGVVSVEGIIVSSQEIIERLDSLENDNTVQAILLEINSPGGAVAPAQEIYERVVECETPVIATMGSVGASGGYYIASGADRIFANSGTLTGSIGVIMQLPRYDRLMDNIGVGMRVLTAGELKDAGSPFRDMDASERAYFEKLLNEIHGRFIQDVARGRNMDSSQVAEFATGEIFTGSMAHENGLVDSVGGQQDAVDYILSTYDLPENTPVSRKKETPAFLQYLQESRLSFLFEKKDLLQGGVYYLAPSLL
jgi:protease-4